MEDRNIAYYRNNAEAYAESTLGAEMSGIYSHFLPLLPRNGTILDLGCGSGRDAACFISQGFKVTAVDGSAELCRIAERNAGISVRCMLFEELDYIDAFDGVWACASLLHAGIGSLPDIFNRINAALRAGGYFYSSFKYGRGMREQGGRIFTYLDEAGFRSLADEAGFACTDIFISADACKGREAERWLNAVVKKK